MTFLRKAFLFLILFTWPFFAKATDHERPVTGGRVGLHGMVLYGSGPYFIDHIPMIMSPHDLQLIAEVSIVRADGEKIAADFSHEGFTIEPSARFALGDLGAGRLMSFQGRIHRGSFERGGPVVTDLGVVTIHMIAVKLVRALPAPRGSLPDEVRIGEKFVANVITPTRSRQEITNEVTGELIWCAKGPDFAESCDGV